jgi:type I restriction enzyme S subunit
VSQPGDVVFTSKGTVGRFAFVESATPRFVYSPQLCFWRSLNPTLIDARFLFCWMRGREFFIQFNGVAGQTDIAEYVSLADQRRMQITLLPLWEQRAIAHTLGTLDDKIELNRRMTETLDAIARALFLEWWAGVVPERRRISDFIANRLLVIGDGYRAKNEEFGMPGLPFIRAGELDDGFDTDHADCLANASVALAREKVSRAGDVAFTSKGTIGRFARVSVRTPRFVYSPQVCFWRSADPPKLRPSLLYLWMRSDDFLEQISQVSHQTDMAPYVSLRDQRNMTMPVFGPDQHGIADALVHRFIQLMQLDVPSALSRRSLPLAGNRGPGSTFAVLVWTAPDGIDVPK